jgi:hypothetical protein
MRRLVPILIIPLSLLAASCTTQVRSTGTGSGPRAPDAPAESPAAMPQAGGPAAARSVAWSRDSSPNPVYLEAIAMPRTDVPLRDLVPGAPWGSYTTATPLLALQVGDGVARLEIVASGVSLLAFLPDGRHVQGASPLVLDRPVAGTYRVHHLLGAIEKASITLEITDPTRGWGADVPVVAIPRPPDQPVVHVGTVRGERRALPGDKCRNGFATEPDVILEIARPLRKVDLVLLRPNDKQRLRIVGPIEPGASRGTARCGAEVLHSDTLHGTYAVFVGAPADEPYGSFHLMLVADGTERAPFYASPKIPDDLPIERRVLRDHFVFQTDSWKSGARLRTPAAAAELFTRAPRALFAYPKQDLTGYISAKHKGLEPMFPRASEPVLVTHAVGRRVWILTADGEEYEVDREKLAGRPAGKIWLPTEPRRRNLSFDALALGYGAERRDALDAYRALKASREKCYYGEWSKVYPDGLPAGTDIYEITVRGGKVVKTQSALDRLHRKLRSKCKLDAVTKAQETLRQTLLQLHIAGWRKALATVRADFETGARE